MELQENSLQAVRSLDQRDPLSVYRAEFEFPRSSSQPLYFAGHSLGLMPKNARRLVNEDLEAWATLGVEGHFEGERPWLPYHESVTPLLARLVGAKESEVVAMNSLTVNLHLALASFYRPHKERRKILIEHGTFPSDKYAVDSQAAFHGLDPQTTIIEAKPRPGEATIRTEDLVGLIQSEGYRLALILLGQCNYLTGQCFDVKAIVKAAQQFEIPVGLNLAHGAGNLALNLHAAQVDFAVWCSYKYLNSGPGGIAGLFVHEKHHHQNLPRLQGWWGHNKNTRFKMGSTFDPIPSVEAWQLSNPPILQLASHLASLRLFDQAGMVALRERGDRLTHYLGQLLNHHLSDRIQVITPPSPQRGSMLCLRFAESPREKVKLWARRGVFVDYREPDIVRVTPAPLYNSFEDIYRLVEVLKEDA